MSRMSVDPSANGGARISIILNRETLAVQADIASSIAALVGVKEIHVATTGIGVAVADQLHHNNIDNQYKVVAYPLGLPA